MVQAMRALILAGGLIGGAAALILMVSGSTGPPADPAGTGLVPASSPLNPLGYLTGVLLLIGGVAIFWFPILATVALGLAAALGVGIGLMGDSQDQLAFGILAIILTAFAVAVVVREGRQPDQVVDAEQRALNEP
jgi:hypothetical protein